MLAGLLLAVPPSAVANDNVFVIGRGSANVASIAVSNTGQAVPVSGSPFGGAGLSSPLGSAVSPNGRHVYVANLSGSTVSGLEVMAHGALSPIAGSPFATGSTGNGGVMVAITPNGKHLFFLKGSANTISRFSIGADGGLTLLGDPTDTGATAGAELAVTPDSRYLYVTHANTPVLTGFEISASGGLTPLPGSPFPYSSNLNTVRQIRITPDGRHAYLFGQVPVGGGSPAGAVGAFEVQASGAVAEITGSPYPTGAPSSGAILGLAIAPDGGHLYATNRANDTISAYEIAESGALAPLTGSPFAIGTAVEPAAATVNPRGTHLFVVQQKASDLGVFSLAASGAPTQVSGSPFAIGVNIPDANSLAIRPDQPPVASFVASPATAGSVTTFNAGVTTDPEGDPISYDWKFGDGSVLPNGGPTPSHTYAAAGDYTVTLTVSDDAGCSTDPVFTGQTAHCNGGPQASTQHSITVAAPPAPPGDSNPPPGDPNPGPAADTLAPEVSILSGPKKSTSKRKAAFTFDTTEPLLSFFCKLDKGEFEVCQSPATFRGLKPGRHTLTLSGADLLFNLDFSPAVWKWRVLR